MEAVELIGIAMLLTGVIWAAISDFLTLRIPNAATLIVVAAFVVYAMATPLAIAWMETLLIAGAVFAIGFLLFALNFIGGGDAKLLAAIALWAGPAQILDLLLITAIAGGGLSLIWLSPLKFALQHVSPGTQGMPASGNGKGVRTRRCIPYAMAIAVGAFAVMPDVPLL